MKEEKILIYTDGACSGNPGPGGWGAVLMYKHHKKTISGYEADTTNNRMELTAAIEALKEVKNNNIEIELFTDSQYVQRGMTDWIDGWIRRGWKKVENKDLWLKLLSAAYGKCIQWKWVRGHNGDVFNEEADRLATEAISVNINAKC